MDESVKLVIEKLEQLAMALQINVAEIFPYFVLRARIQALLSSILFPIGTIVGLKYIKYGLNKGWDEMGTGLLGFLTAILAVITLFIWSYDLVTVFVPEPQAIKDIMKMLIPSE